ncbi:hypothetical protein [Actinomadura sp. WMMA1423]|uniref:hypothetical protein n=1 Tax=Actinomadura sp. WMMA1423 TaxID=2591108 RepID=UPI001147030D|nr:hypothetical protein [Actinomadura sp. WMMA1423]
MTGNELVAKAAVGYLRRVAGRADAEVDRALDAGMDAVHDLVTGKLGADPAFAALAEQSPGRQVGDQAVRRVTDAVETDPAFGERLRLLVGDLQHHEGGSTASGECLVAIGGNNSATVSTGDGTTSVSQHATALGPGRVYQAGQDQTISGR